jgi:glycosyltransferase involved in cell wall biosynthesis
MLQGKLAPRICFVVDLPVEALGGGAEKQCYLIARGLAEKGWDVVYLTPRVASRDLAPRVEEWFKIYRVDVPAESDNRMARYLHGPSLFRNLGRIDPHIVLFTNPGSLGGLVTLCCLLYRKPVVYRAASLLDTDLTFGASGWYEFGFVARCLHRFAVRNANVLVANATSVANQFRKWIPHKNIRVIPNGVEIHRVAPRERRTRHASHVLWMNGMKKWKNPGEFVTLAKELPDVRFVMCGSGPLYKQVAQQASRISNLRLTGGVGGQTKTDLFETAIAFVNTSFTEGFPNTLLESGVHSVPYISFVDPDEVICRHKLGFHVRSFSELVDGTSLLVRDKGLRSEMGFRIRRYVEKHHNIQNTVSEYDELLRSVLLTRRRNTSLHLNG